MVKWENYHLGLNLRGDRVLIVYKPKKGPVDGVLEVQDSVDRTDEFLHLLPKFFENLEKTGRVLLYSRGDENQVILSLDTIIDQLKKIKESTEDILNALENEDYDEVKDLAEDIMSAVEEILKLKKVGLNDKNSR
ncbi:protein of unknown function (plasmid) [Thermococcus nautili]|uniref:hypothetical protein n=1 Tax=Thermococcus nautili TaxID=195522 RepID=UPI002553A6B0|nr:hypothetical protein [Thermococcus nautili]CAI1494123.1 protein of unknown function [Thermococcus nautili]